MKVPNEVTSLQLSKRLRELDVKQGYSLFYWDDSKEDPRLLYYKEINEMHEKFHSAIWDYFSAFTASELLDLLPEVIKLPEVFYITMDCDKHIYYENHDKTKEIYASEDIDTPIESMAKMLIHLIENGLMK